MAAACEVNVLRCDSRFLVKLNIGNFLSAEHNWVFKTEVEQNDEFVARTGLKEAMLYIAEADVHFVSLLCGKSNTVRVNLEISKSFLANEVWPDHQVVECLLATRLDENQLF